MLRGDILLLLMELSATQWPLGGNEIKAWMSSISCMQRLAELFLIFDNEYGRPPSAERHLVVWAWHALDLSLTRKLCC
jgi:hypothetical protein